MKLRLEMRRNWRRQVTFLPGVRDDLARRARSVQSVAGPDYEVDVRRGRTRYRAQVRTANARSARREAETRRLTSALDAARR